MIDSQTGPYSAVHLEPWQYAWGAVAALIIGFSKTGVPGTGILMVPIMASVFGGRLSVGATVPMLVLADCFAVAFYRTHAQWDRLRQLAPWVVGGLLTGTVFLKVLGDGNSKKDILNPVIGVLVLIMLGLSLLRGKWGDRLVPHSKEGTAVTGVVAGFSTMVSNAAGPIMGIYMTATGMPKEQLMGTSAWYFFIFNLSKVPLLLYLTMDNPGKPMITLPTLVFNLEMFPVIVFGALLGRWILKYIPQKPFNATVLVLAAVAAVKLLF
ncbi:MAG: sulfite exporter TauE/SafE family protein [Fimbriimonas sp.]|nr:sulfite exporter TauE/SafE family protein [Fimbriimonas sp.]